MPNGDEVYAACTFALPHPGLALLRITGELDACSAQHIEERVQETLAPRFDQVIIDLRDLEFIDSTGIRLLVQLVTQRQDPKRIVVVSPRALTARRALEIVGLTRVLRTVETVEELLPDQAAASEELQGTAV
jgi:anti-sigma B factor antagonist